MSNQPPGITETYEMVDRPFAFDPKRDMTAWELAYILRFTTDLRSGVSPEIYNQFPLEVQRHFQAS